MLLLLLHFKDYESTRKQINFRNALIVIVSAVIGSRAVTIMLSDADEVHCLSSDIFHHFNIYKFDFHSYLKKQSNNQLFR